MLSERCHKAVEASKTKYLYVVELFPLDFMSLFSCVFYHQKDEFCPFIPRIFTFSLRLFNFWSHFVATTFQDTGHFSQ